MYLQIGSAILAILALLASFYALFLAGKYNVASVTRRQLAQIEAELLEQADAIDTIRTSVRKVTNRINARHARSAKNGESFTPDLSTEAGRTAARLALEADLAKSGRLNPKEHLKSR
jgi:hypothetical protein